MSDLGEVWEATVAIAVRDSQWLVKPPKAARPETHISLAGRTEEDLGDVLFEAAERYYILELKAMRTRISSEWTRSKTIKQENGTKIRVPDPKHAHVAVTELASDWHANQMGKLQRLSVLRCLLAHHFVYWDQHGGLTVEPYLLATLDILRKSRTRSRLPASLHADLLKHFQLASANAPVLARFAGPHDVTSTLPVSALHEGRGCIFEIPVLGSTGSRTRHPLGLTEVSFQKYVSLLTTGSPTEGWPMHAVVLSSTGRFVRVVTNTNHLSALFSPAPAPRAQPENTIGTPEVIIHQPGPIPRAPRHRPSLGSRP